MATSVAMDLRFAWRSFLRTPGAFVLALATLGLGIGVNVTIFSVVNAVLLRPLPYAEPDSLVWLRQQAPERSSESLGLSSGNFREWRKGNRSFADLGAYADRSYYLKGADGVPERVSGAYVTPEVFSVLAVEPIHGRAFTTAEGRPGRDEVVLLGHDLWRRRFGGDPGVLGRAVEIDGRRRTVVGVMGPRFRFPEYAELWAPLASDPARVAWGRGELSGVGRLRPGASLEQARHDLASVARRLEGEHPEENRGITPLLRPLRGYYVGDTGTASLVFLAMTFAILLIVCINLGNFLLARALQRQREIAVRSSLGATRRRILRQLLTESLLLAAAGGAAGLLLGSLGLRLLVRGIPIDLPFWAVFEIDARVAAFAVAATVVAGVVFGLTPALHAFRLDLGSALKEGREQGGLRRRFAMASLVVAELALACAFVLVAGTVAASFVDLQRFDAGFDPPRAATLSVDLRGGSPAEPEEMRVAHGRILAAVEAVPGVERATTATSLPLRGGAYREVAAEGDAADEGWPVAILRVVAPGYFDLLRIPLRSGEVPATGSGGAAVVNETLARRLWPGRDAVGRNLRLVSSRADESDRWLRVAAVVGDTVHDPTASAVMPEVYLSYDEEPVSVFFVLAATSAAPAGLGRELGAAVHRVEPDAVVDDVQPLDEVLSQALWQPRLYTWLLALFAVLGLVLASLGLYGLVAYAVGSRLREIAVRVALGAGRGRVLRLILGQAATLVGVGLALGLAVSFVLARLLGGFLSWFEQPSLAWSLLLLLLFTVAAFVAAFSPARQALRVEPVMAMQVE